MPLYCPLEVVNKIHVTSQEFSKLQKDIFWSLSRKTEELRNLKKREEILSRWSCQDYPLNMASQSFWAIRWTHFNLNFIVFCMFVPVYRCVFVAARSGRGYSKKKCGLSFDPAALKHTAPPTLVLSCILTSVLWLKYHCFPHKHLL